MLRFWRIILPALSGAVLFGVTVFCFILPSMEKAILAKKREMIRELTQSAWNIMANYHRMVQQGALSKAEAQARAVETIQAMRYGPEGKDYFWINDMRPYMIMHPYRSDLDGTDLSNFADPSGKRLFLEFVKAVKHNGSGYVGYKWQWKDDPKRIVSKISFVNEFKPWGWIVGTGIYIEDVKAEMRSVIRHPTLWGAAVMFVICLLSGYMIFRQMLSERQRVAAEAALKESLEKNRTVLRASPDPMVVCDNLGNVTYINPAFTRVFGWQAEELCGRRIDFVPADQEEKTSQVLTELYTDQDVPVEFETKRLTKDGRVIDVSISAAVYCNASGAPVGVVVNLKDISALKRVESALRESETLFRSISSNALDAIIMIDPAGKCYFWNKAAEQIFGYSAQEMLGQDLHRIMAPNSLRQRYATLLKRFANGRGPEVGKTLELTGKCKDGSMIDVEVSISFLQLNEQWYAISIIRDITQRKQTEQAIINSESRYRTLFDAAYDPTFLLKGNSFFDCNAKTSSVFGASKKELLGRSPVNFSPELQPDGAPSLTKAREVMGKAYTGEAQIFEWRHMRADGAEFDSEVSLSRIEIDGEPYLLATVRDITQRKKDEDERLRLATAIEQANEDVIITDKDGNIQYVNPAFERVTGYTRQEVIGKTPDYLSGGRHDDTFARQLWQSVESSTAWTGRVTSYGKDDRVILQDATISPIRDAGGRISGYVSVRRDISKQVELENRLRQAHKMEAIGTLAGGIAHDFNNILGGIIGFTEISLAAAEPDSRLGHNLKRILDAANRAAELVKQILTFSRQSEQETKPVDIGVVAEEVVKMLQATLPATIEIRKQISHNATIMGDPTQLHQVILNLCTNAAQAMRQNGGRLTVTLKRVELERKQAFMFGSLPPGRYQKLTVADTGHGMKKDLLERVFDPFFTTKEKGEGTGMGLAVVHGIVTSRGGDIAINSEPGLGTTVDIYLPEILTDGMSEAPGVRISPLPTGSEHVMLVDDEEMLLAVWQDLLQELGYQITAASSGRRALELFQQDPDSFDLLITDYTMPHMTGLELADEVLALRPEVPIILCTGFSEQVTSDVAASRGVKRFVMKPIVSRDFAEIIREVLDEVNSAG